MQTIEVMGFLASGLSIVSGLPQAAKTLRTRSAGDLSLATLLLAVVAHVLWIGYALALELWPVLLPNLFSFALVASLTTMKLAFDRRLSAAPATKTWPAGRAPPPRR
jgi:MtN3 and saliva related transmembrane protein